MKRLYAAAALVLICIGLGIFEHFEVQNKCDECLKNISKIEKLTEKKNKKKAVKKCRYIAESFADSSSDQMYWYYAHETLSDISANLSEMYEYLRHDDNTQFYAVSSITRNQLRSAKEYEMINIQNIL